MNSSANVERHLRVGVNAALPYAGRGGIHGVVLGLVSALGQLEDGLEEYSIVGATGQSGWLQSIIASNQTLVEFPRAGHSASSETGWAERAKRLLVPLRGPLAHIKRRLVRAPFSTRESDSEARGTGDAAGFWAELVCDIVHFPFQRFFATNAPSIYTPHDLQHRHYPEFFASGIAQRVDDMQIKGCSAASIVAVAANWVKDDVIAEYGICADKIAVIPWAPPTALLPEPSCEDVESVRKRYSLPDRFCYYPAVAWPHKNHERLLRALAKIRGSVRRDLHLVCTGGRREPHWSRLRAVISDLGLADQVHFIGVLPLEGVRAIYRAADFVVFPSLFEGGALPVYEAWLDGVPLACSRATMLPELVQDAALLFDPCSEDSIAEALVQLAADPERRTDLVKKGRARVQEFTWERVARTYRALYRKIVGRSLSREDGALIAASFQKEAKPGREE